MAKHSWLAIIVAALPLFAPVFAQAGEWRVSPIRLDLDRNSKSGSLTVFNEGTSRVKLQMRALEWTQNQKGEDEYREARDLIYFPRLMTLEPNEQKIVRAGITVPAASREKSYRLFIEEIPDPHQALGTAVNLAVKFGVPVFSRPLKEEVKGDVSALEMAGGKLSALVTNTGNVHFRITAIKVTGFDQQGKAVLSQDLDGWYVLSGASRSYSTAIAPEICRSLARIELQAATEQMPLQRSLPVTKAACPP